jgi:hypothetical protein
MLVYKRLERGTLKFPAAEPDATSVQVNAQTLSLLLWGIDPSNVSRQKRFALPAT